MKRQQSYETNITQAYTFLLEQFAKGMQSINESGKTFISKVINNPLELSQILKRHALNYHEHQCKMLTMLDSLHNASLLNLIQKDGESLLEDYKK